ncbi:MAG: phosphoglucosamine mutase, partial [Actinomycetota bacterium]|nr:phosphoglucosamine mutase [Actinomycetota bacterium]
MGRLFGTDGVRGVAGEELTAELAGNLGRAAVGVLGRHGEGTPTFVVGRDPRDSGEWLEDALVEGIRSAGGDVILAGIEPTPAIAYLTTDLGAASGVVISASHNPPEYNGIKFFAGNGMKLADELEDEIESALADPPGGDQPVGHILAAGDSRDRYVDHILAAAEAPLDGMTVVVDCANGAASLLAPEILRRLGATVHAINVEPNGTNINLACGALFPRVVAAEVVRLGADAGVCLDGDADRALFSDARGGFIDGDQVLASCAVAMKASGALTHNTVVSTVMANLGFYLAMREAGIEVIAAKVGDRYVLEEMLRVGAVVGGEQSGHVIFREHATTGDGLLTAVRFLTLAARDQRSVEDVASVMRRFPQAMINVPVADREGVATNRTISEAVRSAEDALG